MAPPALPRALGLDHDFTGVQIHSPISSQAPNGGRHRSRGQRRIPCRDVSARWAICGLIRRSRRPLLSLVTLVASPSRAGGRLAKSSRRVRIPRCAWALEGGLWCVPALACPPERCTDPLGPVFFGIGISFVMWLQERLSQPPCSVFFGSFPRTGVCKAAVGGAEDVAAPLAVRGAIPADRSVAHRAARHVASVDLFAASGARDGAEDAAHPSIAPVDPSCFGRWVGHEHRWWGSGQWG